MEDEDWDQVIRDFQSSYCFFSISVSSLTIKLYIAQ